MIRGEISVKRFSGKAPLISINKYVSHSFEFKPHFDNMFLNTIAVNLYSFFKTDIWNIYNGWDANKWNLTKFGPLDWEDSEQIHFLFVSEKKLRQRFAIGVSYEIKSVDKAMWIVPLSHFLLKLNFKAKQIKME